MNPIKFLAAIPNPKDATSFYRGAGPLGHLRRQGLIDFRIVENDNINWATLQQYDLVFMQRPAMPEHIQVIKLAQACSMPVWIDYDDHVFDVPDDNPAWKYYGRNDIKDLCKEALTLANAVTVSTEKLRQVFSQYTQKIAVVPNSYPPEIFSNLPELPRKKKVLWRGTDTHQRDLMTYDKQIVSVMKKHPDWDITFLGYHPWWFSDDIKSQYGFRAAGGILDYFKIFYEEAPAIVIVPLHTSEFNKSKSMIAWLESTLMGAVCLAPAFEEWARPGCSHYTNEEGFERSLDMLMTSFTENTNALLADHKASMDYAKANLSLDVTNETRKRIILQLCGKALKEPLKEYL